jgi:hypothetical protein
MFVADTIVWDAAGDLLPVAGDVATGGDDQEE